MSLSRLQREFRTIHAWSLTPTDTAFCYAAFYSAHHVYEILLRGCSKYLQSSRMGLTLDDTGHFYNWLETFAEIGGEECGSFISATEGESVEARALEYPT